MVKRIGRAAASVLLLLLLLTATTGSAVPTEDGQRVWRVCVTDAILPPFLYNDPNRLGIMERIVMAASHEVGLNTVILRYPTQRCRQMMDNGTADSQIFSPTPMNFAAYQFPMKGGAVDSSRRLAQVHLVWVKRAGTPYEWTANGFTGGKPEDTLVGTRAGLRVAIEPLTKLGFKVDSTAANTLQTLRKLDRSRVDIALVQQEELAVTMDDERQNELIILPRIFAPIDYYTAIRKNPSPENQEQIEAWWNAIGRLRDLPEFKPY